MQFSYCSFSTIIVIRGWLVRRHVNGTRNLRKVHPEKAKSKRRPSRNISELKVLFCEALIS